MAKIVPQQPGRLLVGAAQVGDGAEVAHVQVLAGARGSSAEQAFVRALTSPDDGFTAVLAIPAPASLAAPRTVLFNKLAIRDARQAAQVFGPAQRAVAQAVADCVRDGTIGQSDATNLFICVGVFIHGLARDEARIWRFNHLATRAALRRAVFGWPSAGQTITPAAEIDPAGPPFAAA
ncbi:formaldehyde-activating enzyme [Xanthobacter sp. ZOL 2024]